jgi:hypothetical protein
MNYLLNLVITWPWDNGWRLFWLKHFSYPLQPKIGMFR